jgi:hypothetical protein
MTMARYRVKGPDGSTYVFEGPDGASDADVLAFANQTFGPAMKPPAPAPAQPDDPGVLQSTLIGAGRTTDQVIDGVKQLWHKATGNDQALAELEADQAEKARLYKPLQELHPMATAIGESLPAAVVPMGATGTVLGTAGKLAVAGALPGALEYGTAEERAGRAAGGAAAGVVGGLVVPKVLNTVATAVPAVGRTLKAVVEPLTDGGRQNIAGRTLVNAAGSDAAVAGQRLASAAPLVPGSMPTAAQVAQNGGLAALERSMAAIQPAEFAQRGMEQAAARTGALRGLAKDDAAMGAALAARKQISDPLFQQAKGATYPMDGRIAELLQRPDMKAALARAEKLAANDGRAFSFGVEAPNAFAGLGVPTQQSTQINGRSLYDLKMAVDEMLTDPTSGFAGKAGDSLRANRGRLINWMEDMNPAFREARTTYAAMSQPINQMQVGQTLLQKLEPALADHGGLARETAAKYATALRNADQTARQATGFKGAGLSDILTPDQQDLVTNIAKDLARKMNAQELGRGVGSDTVQKLSMSNLAERSGAPGVMGAVLGMPGVNKIGKFLYQGPDEQIQSLLAQSLLDPQLAAQLMGRPGALPGPRIPANLLTAPPSRPAQALGVLGGLAATQ